MRAQLRSLTLVLLVLAALGLATPAARADQVLMRPTDGPRDQYGDGYATASQRACSTRICIHWVPTGPDAPPSRSWVTTTLQVMNRVWRTEVDRLGFRAPLPDGHQGGDHRFDVYLKDLGTTGAYGYCAPSPAAGGAGTRLTAPAYCVLDNDFSPEQYAAPALVSLRVTAAHEFFHAVQFAYDDAEDPWFMESTAVWMEERAAGGADDNRQFLPYGQLVDPGGPLDHFEGDGFTQYGNWVWWEYLSERFGTGIVRQVWEAAAADRSHNLYSTAALRQVLGSRGGFPRIFADYASATTDATRSYLEGDRWPAAAPSGAQVLTATAPSRTTRTRIDHMASSSYAFVPDAATLTARRWSLRVLVKGPRAVSDPEARVRIVKTDGRIADRVLTIDRNGRGRTQVPFSAGGVQRVTVTLVNASTRFRCAEGSSAYSCQGEPRDDRQPFVLRVGAFRP